MGNPKCPSCGLTNFATAQTCRRCGQPVNLPAPPQPVYYPPPAATYQPPPSVPPPLPSVWQGHHPQGQTPEPYYPNQTQLPPAPESYYPNQTQQWQAPPPVWQPPQPPGQVYNSQWQAPPPQQPWQNLNPPMAPAYA